MGTVYANLSLSLDGFAAGPDDSPEHPLGVGGEQLHAWMSDERNADVLSELGRGYGAVVIGRRIFDLGEPFWRPDPPFNTPVYVVTHRERPPTTIGDAEYTFVTDGFTAAMERARATAGDQDIWICGGANVVQQALLAGVLDVLQVQVVPVMLGGGRRPFDGPALADVPLSRIARWTAAGSPTFDTGSHALRIDRIRERFPAV